MLARTATRHEDPVDDPEVRVQGGEPGRDTGRPGRLRPRGRQPHDDDGSCPGHAGDQLVGEEARAAEEDETARSIEKSGGWNAVGISRPVCENVKGSLKPLLSASRLACTW